MLAAILLLACNAMMSNFLYTLVTTAKVPNLYVGSVFGIASAIGYSSDLYLYTICGHYLDAWGNDGYKIVWFVGVIGGLLMFAMGRAIKKTYGFEAMEEEVKEEAKAN